VKVALRSVGLVYLERYFSVFATLATSMVVARILTPEEVGLQSVAIAFVSIMQLFRDLGLATYIHTIDDLTQERFSACLGLSALTGVALFLIVLGLSQFAEPIFNDSRVGDILQLLSLNFLLFPIQTIVFAVLVRRSRFKRILIYTLALQTFSAIATVSLALAGYSYFTSAISAVLTGLMGVILSILARERDLLLRPTLGHIRSITSVSLWPLANSIVRFASERTPEIVIGRSVGFASSAYFEKALSGAEFARRLSLDGLYSLFVGNLNAQTAAGTHGREYAAALYLSYGLVLGLPLAALVSLSSAHIIDLMFGAQWVRSAPLLSILAPLAPLVFLTTALNQILYSRGEHRTASIVSIAVRVATIITIALTFDGTLEKVCVTVLTFEAVLVAALLGCARNVIEWPAIRANVGASLPAFTIASAVGACAAFLLNEHAHWGSFLSLLAITTSYCSSWLLAIFATRHPLVMQHLPRK
jgi:O-antigen/teichoic acid export membrane protein